LHADVIAVGIVNERGIINSTTLSRILDLTREIQKIPGVVSRDVTSLSTIDNLTARAGELVVHPALDDVPESEADLQAFRAGLLGNPLFVNRIVSPDANATAIYVPIEPAANGREIADAIRRLLPRNPGDDRYFLAGDPVARDTFGAEMFRQMGLFSPIAGLVMAVALWLMFRSVPLVVANMAVAIVSIVWSMGLLVGVGYPVHIMSSMSPIFLMAIATDSVHIFNEFAFRFGETQDKRRAVLDTIRAVAGPVFYSDVTTAAGFASLATASIVPVKIFGLVVGFGTLVILLMSFTLVPAILMLLREERIDVMARRSPAIDSRTGRGLSRLGDLAVHHARTIGVAGGALLVLGILGLSRIQINNNMIHWFKASSDVRTADRIMNARLGGTSTAYLVVQSPAGNAIKDPAMLRSIEGLQRDLEKDSFVGKTHSVVDYVKRINRILHDDDPSFDRVPDSAAEVGQYLFLFGASARPSDLDNVVDYPYQKANIILQLRSWDAGVTKDVIRRAEAHLAAHPLPGGATLRPAGIAYFNLVWNREVLRDMIRTFGAALAVVLVILTVSFRSWRWGLVCFVPLGLTILLIYGALGYVGKDFDMPVSVLSALSLGMAVDFAIHFIRRYRQRLADDPDTRRALLWTVARPGKGIVRNALLFSLAFAVMLFSSLTPYITVGAFIIAMMMLSACFTLFYLPALIVLFAGRERTAEASAHAGTVNPVAGHRRT
jgi:hypothetical protein